MKTRKEYARELIALDKELSKIQKKMKDLRMKYITKYGIFEWSEFTEQLRHTV